MSKYDKIYMLIGIFYMSMSNPETVDGVDIGTFDSVRGYLHSLADSSHTVGSEAEELVTRGRLLDRHKYWDRAVRLDVRTTLAFDPTEVLVILCWEHDNRPYTCFVVDAKDMAELSLELYSNPSWETEKFVGKENVTEFETALELEKRS